jgi:hypothetical protein
MNRSPDLFRTGWDFFFASKEDLTAEHAEGAEKRIFLLYSPFFSTLSAVYV